MNTKRSRFHGLFEEQQHNEAEPAIQEHTDRTVAPAGDTMEENLKSRKKEIKKRRIQEDTSSKASRIKTNYEIRADYVRAMKRIAVDDGRKIYEVLEEAIGQYLEQRKQSNP